MTTATSPKQTSSLLDGCQSMRFGAINNSADSEFSATLTASGRQLATAKDCKQKHGCNWYVWILYARSLGELDSHNVSLAIYSCYFLQGFAILFWSRISDE